MQVKKPAMQDSRPLRVLDTRSLNRALLERQSLLRRSAVPAHRMIHRLIGLQAQLPNSPYIALWSRLASFRHDDLTQLLNRRRAVRSVLMRATIHLVLDSDFLWLRPLVQPVLSRAARGAFARRTAGVDLVELAAFAEALLRVKPSDRMLLRKAIEQQWPSRDAEALAWIVQYLLPLVRVPPAGTWGKGGSAASALADSWLGRPLVASGSPQALIRRYLRAFGPATLADIQSWSGLSGLGAALETMRLRTFQDEKGRKLFDVAGCAFPDPAIPAPPRFLPDYDNALLGHADRARIVADHCRKRVGIGTPTLLIDGFVRASWKIDRKREMATLAVQPFAPISKPELVAVEAEGLRLLQFAAADAGKYQVVVSRPG